MSLLVPELSQIVDRLLVVAPGEAHLKEAFESLSFELTSDLGTRQNLELAATSMPEGAIQYWTSFTLGQRAQAAVRISLVGVTLEALHKEPRLLGTCDGVLFFVPPQLAQANSLMSLKVSAANRASPWVTVGLNQKFEGQDHLASLALVEWLDRNFMHVRHLSPGPKTLAEGLEWVLSF